MYSHEGVDRKGIITSIVGTDNQAHNAFNAEYMSYVLHVNYRFAPKWNLFAKGMYETASVYKASDEVEKGKYRTAWGYAGGIEFYPMESNLHFFLAYVGRSYKYTDRAKALGEDSGIHLADACILAHVFLFCLLFCIALPPLGDSVMAG